MTGTAMDIPLLKEDSVFILAKDSLQDIPTISVGGNVRAPGVFQYRQGMSLEDVILMAGGFTNAAATHKIEINRLERNKADTLANRLLNIIKVDIDSSLHNAAAKTPIEALDYVFVPRLLNYTSLGSVKLRGEVLYSGDYALEKRDETIQEVIRRAGGISPYASMSDAQVYRGNLRVATDLLASGGSKFQLLPDDSIYIPRSEPFVEVKGAVFNPQIISYESSNFLSYISDAGGVTDKANLRKAYIQYSNGINSKIHHFLFFRIYPKVLAGSKIIVPEKPEGARRGLNIVEVSALTGSLSALIGLISILRN
jgi:protein involved in polysaccharide export with SLBB domain